MSRVGKKPVPVPDGVKVKVEEATVRVEGPKGKLAFTLHPRVRAEVAQKQVLVHPAGGSKLDRSLHGLTRTLIANMVQGVSQGFAKELDIEGVGGGGPYRKTKHPNQCKPLPAQEEGNQHE